MDKMKFNDRETRILDHIANTMRSKVAPEANPFTEEEKQELLFALESGGTLLYVSNDPNILAKVTSQDKNAVIKEGQQLSKEVSLKLFELYNEPIPSGFHCLFLKGIIEQHC